MSRESIQGFFQVENEFILIQPSLGWFPFAHDSWYVVFDGWLKTQEQFVTMELKEIMSSNQSWLVYEMNTGYS